MKLKLTNVLLTLAISLLFIASSATVIRYILEHRKTASTQTVKSATYDPTPGRYPSRTRLEFSTVPERPRAGELAIWSVKIVDVKEKDRHGQPKYIRSYVQEGGNLINLVVVSDDLSFFKRFAPDYKDYGHFLLQTSLPRAGTYRLFADYIPYGGQREVKQQTFEVGGVSGGNTPDGNTPDGASGAAPEPAAQTSAVSTSGSTAPGTVTQRISVQADDAQGSGALYQVELQASQLVPERKAQLRFTVQDAAGNVVTDMEPYFGARAQGVAISRDGQTYLHLALQEGAGSKGSITFETQFPHAGIYKVWLQFKQRNAVVTAPFLITVAAGTSDATKGTANVGMAKKG